MGVTYNIIKETVIDMGLWHVRSSVVARAMVTGPNC